MMQSWLVLLFVCSSIFVQISQGIANSPNRTYPNFSDLEEEKDQTTKNASPQCTIYNQQNSKNFDVYQNCLKVAYEKSSIGYVACETAKIISEILKNCVDINEFDQKLIEITQKNLTQLQNTDGWDIWGIGVAFEPYTFPGVQLHRPYQTNEKFHENSEFKNLMDDYNYYTDCLPEFGDSCTWYHQTKLITYYQKKGGVWINERKYTYRDQSVWGFYVPIVVDGRFYGILTSGAIEP